MSRNIRRCSWCSRKWLPTLACSWRWWARSSLPSLRLTLGKGNFRSSSISTATMKSARNGKMPTPLSKANKTERRAPTCSADHPSSNPTTSSKNTFPQTPTSPNRVPKNDQSNQRTQIARESSPMLEQARMCSRLLCRGMRRIRGRLNRLRVTIMRWRLIRVWLWIIVVSSRSIRVSIGRLRKGRLKVSKEISRLLLWKNKVFQWLIMGFKMLMNRKSRRMERLLKPGPF